MYQMEYFIDILSCCDLITKNPLSLRDFTGNIIFRLSFAIGRKDEFNRTHELNIVPSIFAYVSKQHLILEEY